MDKPDGSLKDACKRVAAMSDPVKTAEEVVRLFRLHRELEEVSAYLGESNEHPEAETVAALSMALYQRMCAKLKEEDKWNA